MTEYKVKTKKGWGYQVFEDGSDLPLPTAQVEYILNAQQQLINKKNDKIKKVAKIIDDVYPFMDNYSKKGFMSVIEQIGLVVFDEWDYSSGD